MNFKDEVKPFVSKEEALWIKDMRLNQDYSFRGIAQECSEKWIQDWGSNQIFGEDICAVAMEVLGENPNDGWW